MRSGAGLVFMSAKLRSGILGNTSETKEDNRLHRQIDTLNI